MAGELFHNLLEAGFNGPVYPVNPKASVVQSVVAYKSVLEVPGPVDLAVLALPAPYVVEAARSAAKVRAIVVISAGFAETGPEGAQRQRELLAVCRAAGMRLIGPNCLGIVNTDPQVRLDATFGPIVPLPGRVGFLSQSGALGLAIIDYANALGLGLSSFVSVGNKADISGNDLLSFWEQDDRTDLVLLYLESFGNPRKFAGIARRVARTKPVLAVKSGRSAAGARATSSHTGALLAASDVTVDALFDQAGVIRTDSLGELFDVASLLANQPIPAGRRVGIVTNAGGPGIMCADACEAGGLEVVQLSAGLQASLAEGLPAEAAVANPVDMLASAPPEHYRRTVELVAASGEVDAVIVIFIPPLPADTAAVVQAVHDETAAAGAVPVLSVVMSAHELPAEATGPAAASPLPVPRGRRPRARPGAWSTGPGASVRRATCPCCQTPATTRPPPCWPRPWPTGRAPAGWPRRRSPGCSPATACPRRVAPGRLPEEAGAAANELGGRSPSRRSRPGWSTRPRPAPSAGLTGADQVRPPPAMAAAVAAAGYPVDGFLVQRMVGEGWSCWSGWSTTPRSVP